VAEGGRELFPQKLDFALSLGRLQFAVSLDFAL
jgi:hypothetical protein